VRTNFGKQSVGRRVIALIAAYVIALSSLITSVGAARADAATTADPHGVICHTIVSGQALPSRSTDETNGRICADCCCVGCLMLMATLPQPTMNVVARLQSVSRAFLPLLTRFLASGPTTKSHQSRAPPPTA